MAKKPNQTNNKKLRQISPMRQTNIERKYNLRKKYYASQRHAKRLVNEGSENEKFLFEGRFFKIIVLEL